MNLKLALRKLSLLLTCVLACNILIAKTVNDAHIVGHVVDKKTGEHIPYYSIHIEGSSMGAMTDESGHYSISNLPAGKYTLEASSVGYVTQHKTVSLTDTTTLELNFLVEPDQLMLEQVVVTGSKSETKRRESPSLINVMPATVFDEVGACSLADGLSFQPGVRVENDCQNCGFTQVRINGLDGHYSQILMNSRPVFSALTGVYGLEQIPANMIDRVEVMRGGGSALFGSSAIGGTVNIITKDPVNNYAEVAHRLSSIGVTGALDNNTTFNASVVGANNKAGITLYGQSRHRDGYDHDGDGFTEIATITSRTLGARTFFKTSELTKLSLEYHTTGEYRRGGDQLDRPPHDAYIAEEVTHSIHAGEASFDLWDRSFNNRLNIFAATQATARKSYYGSDHDLNAYGRTHDFVFTSGAQWTHSFDRLWFMPAELIGGLEYNHNYLHDVTLGYDHDQQQSVNIYSAYIQNEWRDRRWGFLVGARIDKHSMISHPIVSPRANIRFNPTDKINFRLSYSTGFRSPQAYDEDFHVAIVGGERVVTVLAQNLKQESSNSVSASADLYHTFGNVLTNLLVEGFYTDLRDVFALRSLDHTDALGNAVLERYNGSGATVAGVNVEAKAIMAPHFQLQGGVTWQKSRYKKPEQWSENPEVPAVKRMFRTPDFYGYLTFDIGITKKLRSVITGTYTGSMLVQHYEGSGTPVDEAVTTPRFFDAGLSLNYEFDIFNFVCLELSAGVTNIFNSYQRDFDQGALRDSGYIYGPSTPRSLFCSARLHL